MLEYKSTKKKRQKRIFVEFCNQPFANTVVFYNRNILLEIHAIIGANLRATAFDVETAVASCFQRSRGKILADIRSAAIAVALCVY